MNFNFDYEIEKIKNGERGQEIKREKLKELKIDILNSIETMKQHIQNNQPQCGFGCKIDRYRQITDDDVLVVIDSVIKMYDSSLRKYISIENDLIKKSTTLKKKLLELIKLNIIRLG